MTPATRTVMRFLSRLPLARRLSVLSVSVGLALAAVTFQPLPISAQQDSYFPSPTGTGTAVGSLSATPSPNALITNPLIVSELHGTVQVQGTVNSTGLKNFFLETRALNDDASEPAASVSWSPVTLPAAKPVQADVLGSWDTTLLPDGLYELRLNVVATDPNQPSTYFVVTPLRISNAPYLTMTPGATMQRVTNTGTPIITASMTSNVRAGDSIGFPVIGYLQHGSSATILGISNTGSGWYYVQLADGSKGWISPVVGVVSGDISTIATVVAPAPIIVTPTLVASALLLNGIVLSPAAPECGSVFTVAVNVNNPSNGTTAAGTVYVQDVDLTSKTVTVTATANLPALNPGANYVLSIPLTVVTYYNQPHQVQVTVAGSQIVANYTLAQAQCNISSATRAATTVAAGSPTTAAATPSVSSTLTITPMATSSAATVAATRTP